MPDLEVHERLTIPSNQLHLSYAKSGGPGGQHVNTTDTRVRLHFDITRCPNLPHGMRQRVIDALKSKLTQDGVLVLTSDRYRSRQRNIEDVFERLKALLLSHRTPPKKRRPTKPTKGSQKRRVEAKKRRSNIKANRKKPRYD